MLCSMSLELWLQSGRLSGVVGPLNVLSVVYTIDSNNDPFSCIGCSLSVALTCYNSSNFLWEIDDQQSCHL